MMSLVLGVGIVSMATVLVTGNPYVCLFGFCAFEATCGIYFPAMGTIRGEYLPNDTRSTIMNLARVRAALAPTPSRPTIRPSVAPCRCCVLNAVSLLGVAADRSR